MKDTAKHELGLRDIRINLNGKRLITINRTVAPGCALTVMGPSGSGKSTLLAFIGGFLDPVFSAQGHVFCGSDEITNLPPHKRRAGLLFQDPLLFPHMSVGGNLMFACTSEITDRSERRERAAEILTALDLRDYFDADPDTLSGGQKARVALGRVLVSEPSFLLLDEPFSKLDMELRSQMRDLVFDRSRRLGLPVVLVTHDQADANAANGDVVHVE
ncbi:MAG: ATP-binding cassette domain-containing protein [Pseudomonadota bacterium]